MDYMNDNDKAIHALMVTWFHWGIHGWIPYTVVGALIGIMSYRRDSTLWNHYYDYRCRYCCRRRCCRRCHYYHGFAMTFVDRSVISSLSSNTVPYTHCTCLT